MAEDGSKGQEAVQNVRGQPVPSPESSSIHYTELAAAQPGSPLCREWNTYRREVGRLLGEGQQGKFVLIKDEEIIGIYDTHEAALAKGNQRYLGQPFLVHPIREREPVLRVRGYNLPWPISNIQLAKPG